MKKDGAFDEAQYKKSDGSNAVMDNSFTLAIGEAFWVHTTATGASLLFSRTFVNSDLTDTYNNRISNPFIKEEPLMTIVLNDINANYNDYCYVGFNNVATDAKDAQIDAYKMSQSFHYLPNIATVMNGSNLLKNVMNSSTDQIVPVRIYTANPSNVVKNYSLSFSNVEEIMDYNKTIVLEDRTLNTFTELSGDTKIDFSMADDNKEPRFFLHISTPIIFTAEQVSCSGKSNGKATASMNQSGSYSFVWRNEDGTVIKNEKNSTSSVCSGLTPGNYVLEVNNVKQKFTITQPEEVKADFVAFYGGLNYGGQVSTQDEETLVVNAGELITFESQALNQTSNIWDFGDRSTSSLENTTHIYFEEGVYKVELTSTNGSCSATNYKTIQVNAATSISETNLLDEVNVLVKENDIFVYMNNQNNSGNVKFEVLNTVGQVVYSSTKAVNNNHIEKIRIDEAAGLYFLTIEGFNQSKTKKIILN